MKIGVLALQGDVEEHLLMAEKAAGEEDEVLKVKKANLVKTLDALIIPGGESTTLGKLMVKYSIDKAIDENKNLAIFGTCAGAILLSKRIIGYENQFSLKKMDISIERNAFGRQVESFEADLLIPELGEEALHAVFIRAPIIREVGEKVKVLAKVDDAVVLAKQGRYLASSFHPELTSDIRLHKYFFDMARGLF